MIALTAAAKAARVPGASLLQLLAQAGPTQSRAMHTALARSVVLPRLLDTLSTTFQQSSTRMDGLIDTMTQELGKVCQDWRLQQLRHLVPPGLAAFAASVLIDFTELFYIVTMWTLQPYRLHTVSSSATWHKLSVSRQVCVQGTGPPSCYCLSLHTVTLPTKHYGIDIAQTLLH